MFKIFSMFILLYSKCLFADDFIVGKWHGKSNSNEHVYSLDVIKSGHDMLLSYVFIYDGGRKINDQTSKKILLKKASEQCWNGEVSDFFNEEKTMILLCKQDNSLIWKTEFPILYVPQSEVFIE